MQNLAIVQKSTIYDLTSCSQTYNPFLPASRDPSKIPVYTRVQLLEFIAFI
jgi:hypothetical protein